MPISRVMKGTTVAEGTSEMSAPQSIGETSESHLSKVLKRLAVASLVRSTEGPAGGFALAKPNHRVALLQVYEVLEGPLSSCKWLFGTRICSGEDCIFGDELLEPGTKLRRWLSGTRLSQLAQVFARQQDGARPDRSCSTGTGRFQALAKSAGR